MVILLYVLIYAISMNSLMYTKNIVRYIFNVANRVAESLFYPLSLSP